MATVPVEVTAVAGSILTAAMWNSNVRDAINFVISPPLAVLRQTVAQGIPNLQGTAIAFDAEDIDRDNGHSTTSNTSRYTAQTAGWYALEGVAAFAPASTAGNRRNNEWDVNGNPVAASSNKQVPIGGAVDNSVITVVSRTLYLNVGDYVEMKVLQDSGATLNTGVTGSSASYMSARWVST